MPLAQQTVGVFIRAALPRTVRVAEEDLQPRVDAQLRMLSHLSTLVPGQGPAQLFGSVTMLDAMAARMASAP